MIVSYLIGGLGNMMFKVAGTIGIALDNGTDCSFPNLTSHLNYLNGERNFNPSLKHAHSYYEIFSKIRTDFDNQKLPVISFPFHYEKKIIENDVIINGFFQSERYFINYRDKILEIFKIPDTIKETIDSKYSEILKGRTASIHVRRGDYLKYQNHHPTQSLSYYHKSIELLNDKVDTFLIFSDDIGWCKENIKGENILYIDNELDYIELYLMSLCDNNIIANSSFSWWGAWLNENPDKIVIAPKRWFGPAIRENSDDIIPNNWIKI